MSLQKDIANLGHFSNLSHTIKDSAHLVHFYDQSHTLYDSVCNFVVPALTANQGVIIIAVKENIKSFESYLEKRSLDVAKSKYLGQLVIFDAHETLKKITTNNAVDPIKFLDVIGSVMMSVKQTYPNVRAYGEMVNILWNAGEHENAISLEKMWNELAKVHRFSLLCSYKFEDNEAALKHPCFEKVCDSHSHLITQDGELKLFRKK